MEVTGKIKETLFFLVSAIILILSSCTQKTKIDRFALVTRNRIENSGIDSALLWLQSRPGVGTMMESKMGKY